MKLLVKSIEDESQVFLIPFENGTITGDSVVIVDLDGDEHIFDIEKYEFLCFD